jgi:hypothetical protein
VNRGAALLALCGMTFAAAGQNTRLVFEVSRDGGATWVGDFHDGPGLTFLVRVRAQFVGTQTPLGFGGITFQPTLTNWVGAGFADIRQPFTNPNGEGVDLNAAGGAATGRINPFASAGMGSASASGLMTSFNDPGSVLRFAGSKCTTATTNLAWGVNCGQLPQSLAGTSFNTSLDVVIFRYAVTIPSQTLSANRLLIASTNAATILNGRGSWYMNASGTDVLQASVSTQFIQNAAVFIEFPAPGSVAVMILGLVMMLRRRSTPQKGLP